MCPPWCPPKNMVLTAFRRFEHVLSNDFTIFHIVLLSIYNLMKSKTSFILEVLGYFVISCFDTDTRQRFYIQTQIRLNTILTLTIKHFLVINKDKGRNLVLSCFVVLSAIPYFLLTNFQLDEYSWNLKFLHNTKLKLKISRYVEKTFIKCCFLMSFCRCYQVNPSFLVLEWAIYN